MRASRLFCIAVSVVASLSLACAMAGAQELVVNGDFEGGWHSAEVDVPQNGGCMADGWHGWSVPLPPTQFSPSGQPAFWEMPGDNCTADDGNNYQRIIGGAIRSSNFRGGIYQQVPTVPGQQYDFDIQIRFNSTNEDLEDPGRAFIGYDLTGQTSDPLASSVVWTLPGVVEDTDVWNQYHLRFTAAGSAVSIWVRAQTPEMNTTVICDIDNASVKPAATPDITIVEGPTAVRLSDTSFLITWRTDIPSDSVVQYTAGGAPNTDDGIIYAREVSTSGLTLEHNVILPGLAPETVHNYRVLSNAPGYKSVASPNRRFSTPGAPASFFMNGSFEAVDIDGNHTIQPWRRIGNFDPVPIGPYPPSGGATWPGFGSHKATDGSYFIGMKSAYQLKYGGVYQRVKSVAGQSYQVTCDFKTALYQNDFSSRPPLGTCDYSDCQVWLGIDPNGGNDPYASSIVWDKKWTEGYRLNPSPIILPTVGQASTPLVTATGDVITVWVWFYQKWGLAWNSMSADNVKLFGPPAEATPVNSVGEAKSQQDFAFVDFQTDSVVTLSPVAETGYFYMQDPDGTAGIRVETATTPLPAQGSLVRVKGVLGTNPNGERVLRDAKFTVGGTGTTKVRTVVNKSIGGNEYIESLQKGLSNQGLYMRIVGRAVKVDLLNNYFLLDDGSAVNALEPDGIRGVKILGVPFLPNEGDYVAVSGVITAERINGQNIRVLRARDDGSDFEILVPAGS